MRTEPLLRKHVEHHESQVDSAVDREELDHLLALETQGKRVDSPLDNGPAAVVAEIAQTRDGAKGKAAEEHSFRQRNLVSLAGEQRDCADTARVGIHARAQYQALNEGVGQGQTDDDGEDDAHNAYAGPTRLDFAQ